MKTFAKILTIALVVLVLAQVVFMFLPFFHYTPEKTLMLPDPQPTDYSLQSYVWVKTQELEKTFKTLIDDYFVNDYAHGLALTFLVGLIAIGCNVFNGNMLLSQIASVLWGVLCVSTFATNPILEFGTKNTWLVPASLIIGIVGLVVAVARLIPYTVFTIEKNRRKKRLAV